MAQSGSLVASHMSAFGGKADIIQGNADIAKCPLMTQSGHHRHYLIRFQD